MPILLSKHYVKDRNTKSFMHDASILLIPPVMYDVTVLDLVTLSLHL